MYACTDMGEPYRPAGGRHYGKMERVNAAPGTTVADIGEFALIALIRERLGAVSPGVGPGLIIGPGDDAAEVSAPGGSFLISSDLLVEGRHFRRDWSSAEDVGRKAAAANLSDINA